MRQSDALFCHTRDLGEVIGECLSDLPDLPLLGIGVSTAPRRQKGSYMPCFLAGVNAANAAAALAGVPLLTFSHQEGHIEAVRLGAEKAGRIFDERAFYAFHLSGGTTEFLKVKEDGGRYEVQVVAEALDLTLGQLIDRCGVALGLPFPAGAALEALAMKSDKKFTVKIPKKEGGINLSGFENQFMERLARGEAKEDLARFIFTVAHKAISALLEYKEGEGKVLFSGGVTSSRLLRQALESQDHLFASGEYTADNAIGIAALCRKGVCLG